jgi:hypothetical protein
MELYGAERSQPMATGRKSECRENGPTRRKPLPWVATGCLRCSMVGGGRRFESARGLSKKSRKSPPSLSRELGRAPVCSGYGAVYGAFRIRKPPSMPSNGRFLWSSQGPRTARAHPHVPHLAVARTWSNGCAATQTRSMAATAPSAEPRMSRRANSVPACVLAKGRLRRVGALRRVPLQPLVLPSWCSLSRSTSTLTDAGFSVACARSSARRSPSPSRSGSGARPCEGERSGSRARLPVRRAKPRSEAAPSLALGFPCPATAFREC